MNERNFKDRATGITGKYSKKEVVSIIFRYLCLITILLLIVSAIILLSIPAHKETLLKIIAIEVGILLISAITIRLLPRPRIFMRVIRDELSAHDIWFFKQLLKERVTEGSLASDILTVETAKKLLPELKVPDDEWARLLDLLEDKEQ